MTKQATKNDVEYVRKYCQGGTMITIRGVTAEDFRKIADALDKPELWTKEVHEALIKLLNKQYYND